MTDQPQVAVSGETFSEGQRPIINLINELARAWNHGEADAFAAQFGDQADFIHLLGGHMFGREAIAQAHRALFETVYARSHIEYRLERIKPLGPNFVAAFLHQKLTFDQDGVAQTIHARPTLILRAGPDGWKVAVFQNTRIADAGAATAEPAAPEAEAEAAPADSEAAPAKGKKAKASEA